MTKQELLHWVKNEFGTEPEYLWAKYPGYVVLRNKNGKWYGVIMNVPKNKFRIDSDEVVDVLNVKADMTLIDMLVSQPGFFRAYHMNKLQWVSVFLDGSAPDESIRYLLAVSYDMTAAKKTR